MLSVAWLEEVDVVFERLSMAEIVRETGWMIGKDVEARSGLEGWATDIAFRKAEVGEKSAPSSNEGWVERTEWI